MAAPTSAALAKTRASLARRTQSYPPGHPKIVEAQRNHKAAKLADYIARNVADAPDLTREQIDTLHVLLEPARRYLSAAGGAA
jgi:hypothetical protein